MPLACDCWQVHGTFSMAPLCAEQPEGANSSPAWAAPSSPVPAAPDDWPMYRANMAGTATVPAVVPPRVKELWRRPLQGAELTAPICAGGHVFVGDTGGTVSALDAANGKLLWQVSSHAALQFPPAYWNGRIVFGSCDGILYCLDAANGRALGRVETCAEKRFVNIMNRFMSAWPLGGGVVLSPDGVAYTAAGSTAADGTVAAAIDLTNGKLQWRQNYTLDRTEPQLSFGVQGNILLKDNRLYINGGAPIGIVVLDASNGGNPRTAHRLEAGMETFLEPDDTPFSSGPELYSHESARTTIFKRHQGRAYFQTSGTHVALVDGRVFGSRDVQSLDRVVEFMNKSVKDSADILPQLVMQVPADNSRFWASDGSDVCGLAVGQDGLVVLHRDKVEGLSPEGQSLWTTPLPASPVRWGLALTSTACVITLSDGQVICLASHSPASP